ncbi:MAG: hypothetical protein KA104_01545 [Candidatus Pacebacteria bacterium]|nr:hypothetical protein [Candidatus Paceibacterota bacterium]
MKTSIRGLAFRAFSFLVLLSASSSVHAQATSNSGFNSRPIESFAGFFIGLINTVIVPVVFAIAFIVFLWGVFTYFIAGGANEEKRQEGTKFVFSAIIGFVVMVSIWGLVNLAGNLLPGMNNNRPDLPTFGPAKTSPSSGGIQTSTGAGGQGASGETCANGDCSGIPY